MILPCSRIYGDKGNHFPSDLHIYLINAVADIFIMMRPNAVILPQAFFKSSFPCFFRCKRGTLPRRLGCRIRCRRLLSRLYGLASVFFAAARYQHKQQHQQYNISFDIFHFISPWKNLIVQVSMWFSLFFISCTVPTATLPSEHYPNRSYQNSVERQWTSIAVFGVCRETGSTAGLRLHGS